MSSKIEKELLEATDLGTKRGESRQDFIVRLMKAVSGLSDKEWDALSQEAQDWFNSAADAKNAKAETLPDFPDLPKPEETTTRRRGEPKDERLTKVGDVAVVLTKRGKSVTGKVVELDEKIIVLDVKDEGEVEFSMDRVESITVNSGNAGSAEPEDPLAKGNTVTLITKRGKEVTGKVVEVDEDVIVLDVDGKEEEYARDRVETIKPAGGKAATAAAPAATSSRRSTAAADDKPAATDEAKKRSTNPPGVSVGMRIKEIIADDLEASMEDVGKLLKKEGLEFKDTSLKMNYDDCHKFLAVLKAAKRLK